jgi:hypothetical protein
MAHQLGTRGQKLRLTVSSDLRQKDLT